MEKLHNITTTGAPDKNKIERIKTKGEKLFDWSVYGGIGWVVNAVLSVFATDTLYNNKSINGWFKKQVDGLADAKWNILEKKWSGFTTKAVFGGTLCIGGTIVVPLIKWFEDHKGSIVRKWDEKFYGERAKIDPSIIQAHQDMDNAPRQSWLTLLGARITVIGIAFGMGPTIGDYNGLSGKALGKIPVIKHFSSFEGFGASCSRVMGNIVNFFSKEKPLMNEALAKANPLKVQAQEHRALKVAEITGYELTQSATIAAMFYGISKSIAGVFHKKGAPEGENRPKATILHAPVVKADTSLPTQSPTNQVREVMPAERMDERTTEAAQAVAI